MIPALSAAISTGSRPSRCEWSTAGVTTQRCRQRTFVVSQVPAEPDLDDRDRQRPSTDTANATPADHLEERQRYVGLRVDQLQVGLQLGVRLGNRCSLIGFPRDPPPSPVRSPGPSSPASARGRSRRIAPWTPPLVPVVDHPGYDHCGHRRVGERRTHAVRPRRTRADLGVEVDRGVLVGATNPRGRRSGRRRDPLTTECRCGLVTAGAQAELASAVSAYTCRWWTSCRWCRRPVGTSSRPATTRPRSDQTAGDPVPRR